MKDFILQSKKNKTFSHGRIHINRFINMNFKLIDLWFVNFYKFYKTIFNLN